MTLRDSGAGRLTSPPCRALWTLPVNSFKLKKPLSRAPPSLGGAAWNTLMLISKRGARGVQSAAVCQALQPQDQGKRGGGPSQVD